MKPQVSIVMPVYNGQAYVRNAVDSILNQSFSNYEFIIVNDGSTDNSLDIINSYTDQRIKLITQKTLGEGNARNAGMKLANGKYIAIMDCDDISEIDRISHQVSFLEKHKNIIATGSNAKVIDENGDFVFNMISNPNPNIFNRANPSPFIHPSVMFRRNIINEIGLYPDLLIGADVVFFIKMMKYGKLLNINEYLLQYRLSSSSMSMNNMRINNMVNKIIYNYYSYNTFDDNQLSDLSKLLSKQNSITKSFNYHIYLAKKHLWNNYNLDKVRENLFKARSIRNYSFITLVLYLVSFLPKSVIFIIYNSLRRNN